MNHYRTMQAPPESLFHTRGAFRQGLIVLALGLFLAIFSPFVAGQSDLLEVKAAYVYQFSKFTHWPDKIDADITIGVVGGSEVLNAFSTIAGKSVGGGKVVIKSILNDKELSGCCEIIFFGGGDQGEISASLEKLKNEPIVSIVDAELSRGNSAIILFVQSGTKLKFSVNLSRAKQNGIEFDAHLLRVAISVN